MPVYARHTLVEEEARLLLQRACAALLSVYRALQAATPPTNKHNRFSALPLQPLRSSLPIHLFVVANPPTEALEIEILGVSAKFNAATSLQPTGGGVARTSRCGGTPTCYVYDRWGFVPYTWRAGISKKLSMGVHKCLLPFY